MNILYAGGVNNPMDSIEQISYLLFLRLLTEKDEVLASVDKRYTRIFSGKWARFAWGNFVTLTGDSLFNAVRDAIESLHELPGLTKPANSFSAAPPSKSTTAPRFEPLFRAFMASI
jgi:hypothetical protein